MQFFKKPCFSYSESKYWFPFQANLPCKPFTSSASVHHPNVCFPFVQEKKQLFPFRTFAMCISFLLLLLVSFLSRWLFLTFNIHPRYDFGNALPVRRRRITTSSIRTTMRPMNVRMKEFSWIYLNLLEFTLIYLNLF